MTNHHSILNILDVIVLTVFKLKRKIK